MPNDTAITRLLYAMLSQKCLKDIDWNQVARDPILSQEITNGHAARMRYSRFKKQMDGTSSTAPRKPRKTKVSKTSSSTSKPKSRKRSEPDVEGERVKEEAEEAYSQNTYPGAPVPGAGDSFNSNSTSSARDMQTPDPEPGLGMSMHSLGKRGVKTEPGSKLLNYQPTTPLTSFSTPSYSRYAQEASASPSPNTSFNHHVEGMDEGMFHSFGSPGVGMAGVGMGMTPPDLLFGEAQHHQYGGYGIGVNMNYEPMWEGQPEAEYETRERGGERVSVKSEPRWEEEHVRPS